MDNEKLSTLAQAEAERLSAAGHHGAAILIVELLDRLYEAGKRSRSEAAVPQAAPEEPPKRNPVDAHVHRLIDDAISTFDRYLPRRIESIIRSAKARGFMA